MKLLALVALATALSLPVKSAAAAEYKITLDHAVSEFALDGTDVYVATEKRSKDRFGDTQSYTITRRSLVDSSSQKVVVFPKGTMLDSMGAGGGWLVVSRSTTDAYGNSKPTIERISRDGLQRQALATGDELAYESMVVTSSRREDLFWECGTLIGLRGVGSDGSAIIVRDQLERATHRCGDKQTVDRWSYELHAVDGTVTTIATVDQKPKVRRAGHGWTTRQNSPLTGFAFGGTEKIAFHSRTANAPFVFDLASRATRGPYLTGGTGKVQVLLETVSPGGELAVTELRGSRFPGVRRVSGVFNNPAATTSFTPFAKGTAPAYCGPHLVMVTRSSISEIDPVTLLQTRRLATTDARTGVIDCDSTGVYLVTERRTKQTIRLIPFD